jgi:hypothetical protein
MQTRKKLGAIRKIENKKRRTRGERVYSELVETSRSHSGIIGGRGVLGRSPLASSAHESSPSYSRKGLSEKT